MSDEDYKTYGCLAFIIITVDSTMSFITGNIGADQSPDGSGLLIVTGQENIGYSSITPLDNAQSDYTAFMAMTPDITLAIANIGGTTFVPGVIQLTNAALTIGGNSPANQIILNGLGSYVFQVPNGGLTTDTTLNPIIIQLINGARACDVYWAISGAVDFQTTGVNYTHFQGTVIANGDITLGHNSTAMGSLVTLTGTMFLDDNTVTSHVFTCFSEIDDSVDGNLNGLNDVFIGLNGGGTGTTGGPIGLSHGDVLQWNNTNTIWNNQPGLWDSVFIPGTSMVQSGLSGPTFNALPVLTSTYVNLFGSLSTSQLYFHTHMPHSYAEGTNIYPTIHWLPTTNLGTGASGNEVKWGLEYTWSNINSAFPTTNTIYGLSVVAPNTQNTHYLQELNLDTSPTGPTNNGVTGDGQNISSTLLCRIFRLEDVSLTAYTDDAGLIGVGIKFEQIGIGSRQKYSK